MSANKYQKLAERTINHQLTRNQLLLHALHGMAGEIGEIHSLYQKVYQGHSLSEDHLRKEFGDLLWFIAEYCTVSGWDLEDIMDLNIEKLKKRYPEGFDKEKSICRAAGDI